MSAEQQREGVGVEEGHKPDEKPITEKRREVTEKNSERPQGKDKGDSL